MDIYLCLFKINDIFWSKYFKEMERKLKNGYILKTDIILEQKSPCREKKNNYTHSTNHVSPCKWAKRTNVYGIRINDKRKLGCFFKFFRARIYEYIFPTTTQSQQKSIYAKL